MSSLNSPIQPQAPFSYDNSTPPPPPPKPSAHSSGRGTPLTGPPLPPPPPGQSPYPTHSNTPGAQGQGQFDAHVFEQIPPPEPGWLPDVVKQQKCVYSCDLEWTSLTASSVADLTTILSDPSLQSALAAQHPSLQTSNAHLSSLLSANLTLANHLTQLESHLRTRRLATQSRLLALRALERQWRGKQSEQDAALADFSAPALYQRLVSAGADGEDVCRGMEESFLHGAGDTGGSMSEREIQEFVRRYREARRVAFLRRERKERWDEGRVGGWR